MATVRQVHNEAMDIAHVAHYETKDPNEKKRLFGEALKRERKAAEMVAAQVENEPTRSILYRSASCLAESAGEVEECLRLRAEVLPQYRLPAWDTA